MLKETIKENGINLNFHKFKTQNQENHTKEGDEIGDEDEEIFTYLNSREKDLEKSGINKLHKILSKDYDNVDHAVSTNLKHKIVFEEIEKISKRKVVIPTQNEKKERKTLFGKLRSSFNFADLKEVVNQGNQEIRRKNSADIIEVLKEEEPFVEVSDLMKIINENNELNERLEREEVEYILEDLHKLGLIVYFKKKSLSDTIIANPQWFNLVFKSIIDFGRKNLQLFFESVYQKLKETKNKKMKEEFLKTISWLKGGSKKEEIEDIWNDKKELSLSNLDKISFENLLSTLEELITKLIEQKEYWVLEMEELKNVSSLSQKFIFINENTLVAEVIEKVLEDYLKKGGKVYKEKKEFLMNILSLFDFVIPTKKLQYLSDGKFIRNLRSYVVPLLFPPHKPISLYKKSSKEMIESVNGSINLSVDFKKDDWKNFKFENEWIVDYILPFKPSAVWKLLFMRIRGCCVGVNETQRDMFEEVYWMNGFSFYLLENDNTKARSLVELEFIEDKNKLSEVLMRITIKSNLFDINLFYSSLHQTIQTFVREWIVSELSNKITIKITKSKENLVVENIQSHFKISETLGLNDVIEQYILDDYNENEGDQYQKFKCFNCGFSFSLLDIKDNTCDKCNFFLIFFNFF